MSGLRKKIKRKNKKLLTKRKKCSKIILGMIPNNIFGGSK